MSVIDTDRSALDAALANPTAVIFITFGPAGSKGDALYKKAEAGASEPWKSCFVIRDPGVLTSAQRAMFPDSSMYYVFAVSDGAVRKHGPLSDLQRSGGKPSALKIRRAFD